MEKLCEILEKMGNEFLENQVRLYGKNIPEE